MGPLGSYSGTWNSELIITRGHVRNYVIESNNFIGKQACLFAL